MNNVAACLAQQHVGASGDNKLTRRDDRLGDLDSVHYLSWVVIFPPPLLSGDVDHHLRVVSFCKFENALECEHAYDAQNECRNNGERDFYSGISVRLSWKRLTLVTKTKQDVSD